MNAQKIIIAIVATFAAVWVTNVIIHGFILKADYHATQHLWRSEPEMQKHIAWMIAGQLMIASAMTVLWAKGFAEKATPKCACLYGLFMGVFGQAFTAIFYCVAPWPGMLCVKWVVFGLLQSVLLGLVLFAVCKPKPQAV